MGKRALKDYPDLNHPPDAYTNWLKLSAAYAQLSDPENYSAVRDVFVHSRAEDFDDLLSQSIARGIFVFTKLASRLARADLSNLASHMQRDTVLEKVRVARLQ